ncbi:MAG: hypothetical protein QG630_299 [Patescibacteria group bacterium]|nr:hypothetical protein [Patescibacteria group bacterium]
MKNLTIFDFVKETLSRNNTDWRFEADSSSKEFTEKISMVTCILNKKMIELITQHNYEKIPFYVIEDQSYFLTSSGSLEENKEFGRESDGLSTGKKYPVLFHFPFNKFDKEIILNNNLDSQFYYSFLLKETYSQTSKNYNCEILINHHIDNREAYRENGFPRRWWDNDLLKNILFLSKKVEGGCRFVAYNPKSYNWQK